ncbi:MAG: PKD domain-containing protein, partial [Aldersonia sp.]|nr:PKD domain-containing protein [Aldersonia sp.]
RVQLESKNSFVSVSPSQVSMSCTPSCAPVMANTVKVDVTGDFQLLTPILHPFTGGSSTLKLRSSATAQIEVLPNVQPSASAAATPPPPPAPVANFDGAPLSGTAPQTVQFRDLSTGGPTAWSWNFGDGSSSTAQNPSRVYSSPGTYTVTLTASNAGGSSVATKAGYVTVTAPVPAAPVANFTADRTSGNAPLTVTFTDTSTGNPTTWWWYFGDGTAPVTVQGPVVRVFPNPGTYTVVLAVANAGGWSTKPMAITVGTPPPPPDCTQRNGQAGVLPPNVIDKTPAEASSLISAKGLTPRPLDELRSGPRNIVREQSPDHTECVAPGSVVDFRYRP